MTKDFISSGIIQEDRKFDTRCDLKEDFAPPILLWDQKSNTIIYMNLFFISRIKIC